MSISNEIRDVLRTAPGPLTAREVREEFGSDKYTPEQVGSNLSSLTKFGELLRDGEPGKFMYLLDPKFKPKRERVSEVAVPPPVKKAGASKPAMAKTITAKPTKSPPARSVLTTTDTSDPMAWMLRPSLLIMALALIEIHLASHADRTA